MTATESKQTFYIDLSMKQIDFGLCVSSGQVFRWRSLGEAEWLGVDAGHAFYVKQNQQNLYIESLSEKRPVEAIKNWLQYDQDIEEIHEKILSAGPELRPYIEALPGLRLLRPRCPVEAMFSFLCTPNNNLRRILQLVQKLSEYGEPLGILAGQKMTRFPEIQQIALIPEQELREKGFGYRGRTIPSIANQVLKNGGKAWLENLKRMPYAEAHAELCKLEGVGPKLADCIALFALHHDEAVPIDTHLWQAATRLYFPQWRNTSLTHTKYKVVGDFLRNRFGKLASFAHQYLFYDNLLHWRERAKQIKDSS